jgi:hypothetical protein
VFPKSYRTNLILVRINAILDAKMERYQFPNTKWPIIKETSGLHKYKSLQILNFYLKVSGTGNI